MLSCVLDLIQDDKKKIYGIKGDQMDDNLIIMLLFGTRQMIGDEVVKFQSGPVLLPQSFILHH